jgi:hypothetical protein
MDVRSASVTGEGYLSAGKNPSSDADFVRATFSHKGRRKVERPQFVGSGT